jgi:hypothetical protein
MDKALIASIFVALLIGLGFNYALAIAVYQPQIRSLKESVEVLQSLKFNYTSINLGQKFNWTVAEVINIQGNLYAYLGYEPLPPSIYDRLHVARWQNAWLDLTYAVWLPPFNVTLAPYRLQVGFYSNDYLTATFFES